MACMKQQKFWRGKQNYLFILIFLSKLVCALHAKVFLFMIEYGFCESLALLALCKGGSGYQKVLSYIHISVIP